MQVRREVKKLKGGVSAAALAALSAVAVMAAMSSMVTTRALALILLEDANSTLPLDLPLPPRKMHRTSHQCQIDRQNERKSKNSFGRTAVTACARHMGCCEGCGWTDDHIDNVNRGRQCCQSLHKFQGNWSTAASKDRPFCVRHAMEAVNVALACNN